MSAIERRIKPPMCGSGWSHFIVLMLGVTFCPAWAYGQACSSCNSGYAPSHCYPCQPGYAPVVPGMASPSDAPLSAAPGASPTDSLTTPTPATQPSMGPSPSLAGGEQFAATGGSGFAALPSVGGYIDDAIIRNRFRLRYDHSKNMRAARDLDRAGFLYPLAAQLGGNGPNLAFNANGTLDMQELRAYIEWAFHPSVSVFTEVPYRFLNGNGAQAAPFLRGATEPTFSAFSDLTAGFRLSLYNTDDTAVTSQFKVYTPTGDEARGMGTGHTSLEAGLLFQHSRNGFTVFGEVVDWISLETATLQNAGGVTGQTANGNVLRYGLGVGYDIFAEQAPCVENRLTAVFEVVTWSVLDGFATDGTNVFDAQGDTIVNGKYGLRYNRGDHTIYLGYGNVWSQDRWYSDIFRVELAHYF